MATWATQQPAPYPLPDPNAAPQQRAAPQRMVPRRPRSTTPGGAPQDPFAVGAPQGPSASPVQPNGQLNPNFQGSQPQISAGINPYLSEGLQPYQPGFQSAPQQDMRSVPQGQTLQAGGQPGQGAPATQGTQPAQGAPATAPNPYQVTPSATWRNIQGTPTDRTYWENVTAQQLGQQAGGSNFWATLQPGQAVSGSPGYEWIQGADGMWGTQPIASRESGPPGLPDNAMPPEWTDLPRKQFSDPYQAYQFSQFTGPNQGAQEHALQSTLLGQMENGVYSPQQIAAAKEIQKEQALRMSGDRQTELRQNAAGRGALGGGTLAAAERRNQEGAQSDILSAYRDIDLTTAGANATQKLQAAQALNSALSGQMQRGIGSYGATLSGQLPQAEQNQSAWQSGQQLDDDALQRALLDRAWSGELSDANFDRWKGITDSYYTGKAGDREGRALDIEETLGLGNIETNQTRSTLDYVLGLVNAFGGQSLGNQQLGLDWTKLNTQLLGLG